MENASRDATTKMAVVAHRSPATNTSLPHANLDIIDLTDDSPPTSPRHAYHPAPSPLQHRPAKRQRVFPPASQPQPWRVQQQHQQQAPSPTSTSPRPRRSLAECLTTQVIPLVKPGLALVPHQHVPHVSNKIFQMINADALFQAEFAHTGGYLSPSFLERLGPMLDYEIAKLRNEVLQAPPSLLPPATVAVSQPRPVQPPPSSNPNSAPRAPPPQTAPRPQLRAPPPVPNGIPTPISRVPPTPNLTPAPVHKPVSIYTPAPAAASSPVPLSSPAPTSTPAPVSSTIPYSSPVPVPTPRPPRGTRKPFRSIPTTKTPRTALSAEAEKPREWPLLSRRPYLDVEGRRDVKLAASKRLYFQHTPKETGIYHVDFTRAEIECVRNAVRKEQGKQGASRRDPLRELGKALRKRRDTIETLAQQICLKGDLSHRDLGSLLNFLQDAVNKESTPVGQGQALGFRHHEAHEGPRDKRSRTSQLPSLLLAREIEGNRGFGRMRRHVNFHNEFRKVREDDLDVRTEWTNCAGDIATISWVGDHFICGTTTHSDAHNQQYNKPGNLLLCSPAQGRLQAYADHRIVRPLVEKGENGTNAMRESQDAWLYTSVVSSDYDSTNDLAFTSSFDKMVKVWKVDKEAGTMRALATWPHEGNVNFVAACKNGSGLVATAADVPNQAVRVYTVDGNYIQLSGTRSWNEDNLETSDRQTWAYFPATMQWGIAPEVQHLLLVGYSPRSLTGDDNDIPQDKRDSGEICLWDCKTMERRKVLTASTQNVFEVAWHPTQPAFVAATSPSGLHVEDDVKTQVRLFRPSDAPEQAGAFSEVQCLDCPASDINELTLTPCSVSYCYVTAAATDGAVYVWDTSRGDRPIHRLAHGIPLEGDEADEDYDRERDDTGVKFTAWGTTPDRFYTGGSDGVVKVWNVRNQKKALVRVLLEAPAPISSGVFSPDKTKLAIGDATGRVYLLSVNQEDDQQARGATKLPFAGRLPQLSKSRRVPKMFTQHAPPPPPPGEANELDTGIERARHSIAAGHIRIAPNRCIGAVQGPSYASLGLYRAELHKDGEPDQPLLANVEQQQQENQTMFGRRSRLKLLAQASEQHEPRIEQRHAENVAQDLDLRSLSPETQLALKMSGVRLDDPDEYEGDWDLQYELDDWELQDDEELQQG